MIPEPVTTDDLAETLHGALCGCVEPDNIVHPDYRAMARAAQAAMAGLPPLLALFDAEGDPLPGEQPDGDACVDNGDGAYHFSRVQAEMWCDGYNFARARVARLSDALAVTPPPYGEGLRRPGAAGLSPNRSGSPAEAVPAEAGDPHNEAAP